MSELFPARTIALEYISLDDALPESEFLRWYRTTVLLKTDGIAAVTLYRNLKKNLKEGQPRYLAVYRLDVDDPRMLINKITQKRLPDGVKSLHVGVLCDSHLPSGDYLFSAMQYFTVTRGRGDWHRTRFNSPGAIRLKAVSYIIH